MAKIEYVNFDKSGIDQIKTLWEGLNKHHLERSNDFKERYATMTFETRKENLFKKLGSGEMSIELAIDSKMEKPVGYCLSIIVSLPEVEGEVESLYVDPAYRGKGIGDVFMKHALEWMNSKLIKTKKIIVAAGNEEVFSFYEKYRFFPKFTTLEQK